MHLIDKQTRERAILDHARVINALVRLDLHSAEDELRTIVVETSLTNRELFLSLKLESYMNHAGFTPELELGELVILDLLKLTKNIADIYTFGIYQDSHRVFSSHVYLLRTVKEGM